MSWTAVSPTRRRAQARRHYVAEQVNAGRPKHEIAAELGVGVERLRQIRMQHERYARWLAGRPDDCDPWQPERG